MPTPDTFKERIKRSSFTPYIIVILLTMILSWFLFRTSGPDIVITEKHDLIVEKMQAMGKLELLKMSVKDVMHYTMEIPGPDVGYLMVISGEITGCIDLTKIDKSSVKQEDSIVHIKLPEPEICHAQIDLHKTKLYELNNIPLLSDLAVDKKMLTEKMYQKAESYLQNDSLRNIAINESRKNAESILKPVLETICDKKVVLEFGGKMVKP
jgi:hypothetical protein